MAVAAPTATHHPARHSPSTLSRAWQDPRQRSAATLAAHLGALPRLAGLHPLPAAAAVLPLIPLAGEHWRYDERRAGYAWLARWSPTHLPLATARADGWLAAWGWVAERYRLAPALAEWWHGTAWARWAARGARLPAATPDHDDRQELGPWDRLTPVWNDATARRLQAAMSASWPRDPTTARTWTASQWGWVLHGAPPSADRLVAHRHRLGETPGGRALWEAWWSLPALLDATWPAVVASAQGLGQSVPWSALARWPEIDATQWSACLALAAGQQPTTWWRDASLVACLRHPGMPTSAMLHFMDTWTRALEQHGGGRVERPLLLLLEHLTALLHQDPDLHVAARDRWGTSPHPLLRQAARDLRAA